MKLLLGLMIAISGAPQDKPAAPSVPFKDVLACTQARNCRNMVPASIWWFDMAGIPVMTFREDDWVYGLNADGRWGGPLTVFLTMPGDRSPSQLLSFDAAGKLASADLGPQPGDAPQTGATQEQRAASLATWPQRHKKYRIGSAGEEFRDYWQKQADTALAAIARVLNRKPEPTDFAQVFACLQTANCKNMKPGRISAWSDVSGQSGLIFEDNGWTYELYLQGRNATEFTIQLTAPGEQRSSHLLMLDSTGQLSRAQLYAAPPGAPGPLTREQSLQRNQASKAYIPAARLGVEFSEFWQKVADQSLAAIRRQVTK